MKSQTEFERSLAAAMRNSAKRVSVSAEAEDRMWLEIGKIKLNRQQKERIYMKKFSVKLVATVCAVFALSCVTVLAASGALSGWVGHNIAGSRVTSYEQMTEKLLPELEFTPQTVEKFDNGFAFKTADLGEFQAMDDDGNAFGKLYKNLMLEYQNADGEQVVLYVSNEPTVDSAPGVVETREVGDELLEYREMPYLFVPPSYEVSEEDRAAEARGEMYISVGSSEVERMVNCGVQWTMNGVRYNLFGWDLTLGAEGMLDMAEELLTK